VSDKFEVKLCIIWEEELRVAARLLNKLRAATDEEFPEIARDALNACLTALYGLTDENNAVILSADPEKRRFGKRQKAPK
jgi:hypothetical protein